MTTTKAARPYLDPYATGALLGVVLFAAFYVTGGGLGASAALSRVQTGVLDLVAPVHVDRVAYFAELAGGLEVGDMAGVEEIEATVGHHEGSEGWVEITTPIRKH